VEDATVSAVRFDFNRRLDIYHDIACIFCDFMLHNTLYSKHLYAKGNGRAFSSAAFYLWNYGYFFSY
jgi:hypothetical protein